MPCFEPLLAPLPPGTLVALCCPWKHNSCAHNMPCRAVPLARAQCCYYMHINHRSLHRYTSSPLRPLPARFATCCDACGGAGEHLDHGMLPGTHAAPEAAAAPAQCPPARAPRCGIHEACTARHQHHGIDDVRTPAMCVLWLQGERVVPEPTVPTESLVPTWWLRLGDPS
jgi:hypothetical protein